MKAAVKAAARLLGMDYQPGQQADGEATDWRPLLAEVQQWILHTTPPALQGITRHTDGRNVKVAIAILARMHRYNTTRLCISVRSLALAAGVSKDAMHQGLRDVGQCLFTVEAQHKALTVITLNVDGCLAEMRQKNRADPDLSHLPQATAVYVERMGIDPFLTGDSQKVKELGRQAAIVTGGDFQTWLATILASLGEAVLLLATTVGSGGTGTVAETMATIGRTASTIRTGYRKLEQYGLAVGVQANRRSPKVYQISPDLWQLVDELTPNLRTYGLAVERKDTYLRDSQRWAAKQREMAERQGDTEAAKQATQCYDRLANQRLQETLPVVYPELSPAQRALLALEVRLPRTPHPAQVAKLRRLHATAKLAVAEEKRQAQEALQEQAHQLRQAGLDKREAVRQLPMLVTPQ